MYSVLYVAFYRFCGFLYDESRSYSYMLTRFWNYYYSTKSLTLNDKRKFLETENQDILITKFFDWIPDWEDERDYKLTEFYQYLTAHDMITKVTINDIKTDLSISAHIDTRKTDLINQHDGAAREVAYAVDIAYSSDVFNPLHVDYTLLYKKTINEILADHTRILQGSNNQESGNSYPIPIREVLKIMRKYGLSNSMSHWKLTFYNLEHSLDAIRISLMNGYPVVFGFVVTQDLFEMNCLHEKLLAESGTIRNQEMVTPCRPTYGTSVGCLVGFSENIFKVHVSDKRLFYQNFRPFVYLSGDYLQSNMCNDFYSIVGTHQPPIFQLLQE